MALCEKRRAACLGGLRHGFAKDLDLDVAEVRLQRDRLCRRRQRVGRREEEGGKEGRREGGEGDMEKGGVRGGARGMARACRASHHGG